MAESFPRLGFLRRNFDEIFLLASYIIESHYISNFDASFAEHFYGLRRVDTSDPHALSSLPRSLGLRHANRAVLQLVLLPYLSRKIDDYCRDLHEQRVALEQSGQQLELSSMKQLLLTCFPYLSTGLAAIDVIFAVRYIFFRPSDTSWLPAPSLLFYIIRQRLRRRHVDDWRLVLAQSQQQPSSIESLTSAWSSLRQALRIFLIVLIHPTRWVAAIRSAPRLLHLLLSLPRNLLRSPLLLGVLRIALFSLVFSSQFVEWWRQRSSQSAESDTSIERSLPPPPPVVPGSSLTAEQRQSLRLLPLKSLEVGICPICSKSVQNFCCSPAGIVYCYVCLYKNLEEQQQQLHLEGRTVMRCPVSGVPMDQSMIRKIYT